MGSVGMLAPGIHSNNSIIRSNTRCQMFSYWKKHLEVSGVLITIPETALGQHSQLQCSIHYQCVPVSKPIMNAHTQQPFSCHIQAQGERHIAGMMFCYCASGCKTYKRREADRLLFQNFLIEQQGWTKKIWRDTSHTATCDNLLATVSMKPLPS